MKKGVCVKCHSCEVYKKEKLTPVGIGVLNISHFTRALLDNYVCTACGYVESYVGDRAKLEIIKTKFVKVTGK